jgi:ectoine hydroxylase-related dioxygenase (phytanoyl-CoA dioxygenase family)
MVEPLFQTKNMQFLSAKQPIEPQTMRKLIDEHGCFVCTDVLDADYIARARPALERAIEREVAYHNGDKQFVDYGMVLVCALYGSEFWEPFENPRLMAPFEAVLGEGCIVYAYTSSSMPPNHTNYSRRVHRDVPTTRMSSMVTNMGATICLDDFTLENGATYFLENSHRRVEAPSAEELERDAYRFVVPAGSVFFFDALTWHAGGQNTTDRWRHALTINMCRSWMKQRIDLPRVLEGSDQDLSKMSARARQKLGWLSQVPASYDEYYAPPEKRKFQQKAE